MSDKKRRVDLDSLLKSLEKFKRGEHEPCQSVSEEMLWSPKTTPSQLQQGFDRYKKLKGGTVLSSWGHADDSLYKDTHYTLYRELDKLDPLKAEFFMYEVGAMEILVELGPFSQDTRAKVAREVQRIISEIRPAFTAEIDQATRNNLIRISSHLHVLADRANVAASKAQKRMAGSSDKKAPGFLAAARELVSAYGKDISGTSLWEKTKKWTEGDFFVFDDEQKGRFEVYRDGDEIIQYDRDGRSKSIKAGTFKQTYLRAVKEGMENNR